MRNLNKAKTAAALIFFLLAAYSLFRMVTLGFQSFYLTGTILFAAAGAGFLRSARL